MSRSTDVASRKWPPRWGAPCGPLKHLATQTPPQVPNVDPERLRTLVPDAAPIDARRPPATWLPIADAARALGIDTRTLRRAIARHARRDADGLVLAEFDGVRARKLGRRWRVLLDRSWLADDAATQCEPSP